jgi:hypothetical protein
LVPLLNVALNFTLPKKGRIKITVFNNGRRRRGPGAFQLRTRIVSD